MPTTRRSLVTLIALLWIGSLATPANQAHGDDGSRVEQLEAELTLLRLKLRDAEKKLETQGQPAAEARASTGTVKPIRDITELFKHFPSEAQPERDGRWSRHAIAQAEERLAYAVWGTPFRDELTVFQIAVKENPALTQDASASPWVVEIRFKDSDLEYEGKPIKQSIKPVTVFADDARARRARKLEAGDTIRVRAQLVTVSKVVWGMGHTQPHYALTLRDVDLPGITP